MKETAYAKINLALRVLGREPDGYHRLDTIFAFAEDGDILSAEPAATLTLAVAGPFAADVPAGGDNLVLRAAHALGGGRGAALHLDKRLPVAAGIGGGSADAAAALRVLNRLWDLGLDDSDLLEIARGLGADVPACLKSLPVRGQGRGDDLIPLEAPELAGRPLLLVNPGIPLSTAEVFAHWKPNASGGNDLEAAAVSLVPDIARILDELRRAPGATQVGMSGSGGTCFALFEAEARQIAGPWWQLVTRLR
jgi:4-diphosphocytidyl-2-C-methyl-D-erythritol kinase